jgi:DNA-binding response OmpR family regulator
MSGLSLNTRINLERAEALLLDETLEGLAILHQITAAFGMRRVRHCRSLDEAKRDVMKAHLDLILIGSNGHDASIYDFIRWLRRSGLEPNAFTPTILISGHTQMRNVQQARDCGANFIVARPVSPHVLLERILWIARERRPFISGPGYVGPDRRFHELGPPAGMAERRFESPLVEVEARQTRGAA